MAIKFNDFNNNYNNYNLVVGQKAAKNTQKAEETQKNAKTSAEFKGLENETDLLTQNAQYLYGIKLGKYTNEDKELAQSTNDILASLGYNYKVSAAQAASVAADVNTVVMPGMQSAERAAVEANIKDPNGPFAELFT